MAKLERGANLEQSSGGSSTTSWTWEEGAKEADLYGGKRGDLAEAKMQDVEELASTVSSGKCSRSNSAESFTMMDIPVKHQ